MSPLMIGAREVGPGRPACITAEIGINHNGDLDLALRMIDAAAVAGADAVKFQNYRTEDFVTDRTLTHTYRRDGRTVVESQYELFKRCELSRESLSILKWRCDERGVLFHTTPTSEGGLREAIELGAPVNKNGSDFLTHHRLVEAMARSGLPTVLSTGMATEAEIAAAVRVFRSAGNEKLILLACTAAYPTPIAELHLRRIQRLADEFECLVGLSDHSEGSLAAVCAVALGACWIEKHFTLDRSLPGADQAFSADPLQFADMVRAVRAAEAMLGQERIGPTKSEAYGREAFRLSCTAARTLSAGQAVAVDDLAFRRPGNGISPADADRLIGRRVRRDIAAGALLSADDVI